MSRREVWDGAWKQLTGDRIHSTTALTITLATDITRSDWYEERSLWDIETIYRFWYLLTAAVNIDMTGSSTAISVSPQVSHQVLTIAGWQQFNIMSVKTVREDVIVSYPEAGYNIYFYDKTDHPITHVRRGGEIGKDFLTIPLITPSIWQKMQTPSILKNLEDKQHIPGFAVYRKAVPFRYTNERLKIVSEVFQE